jgi:hypothetical protein
MKKLLSVILVICSLLGGNAYADVIKLSCAPKAFGNADPNWIYKTFEASIDNVNNIYKVNASGYHSKNKKTFTDNYEFNIEKFDTKSLIYSSMTDANLKFKLELENNYKDVQISPSLDGSGGWYLHCKTEEQKQRAEAKESGDITFTIKDKKEQCTAIGFELATEKFADCVLRLVELDVKQQTQNQKTVAQNNGNDALVKQLERQNNLQSSQALINLGQQLMNPKQYNSNIYMPQTRRCTVSGFGATSVVRCY